MGHRAGEISGEGDGCGVLTDLPRALWGERLAAAGHPAELAENPRFAVGHLLIPQPALGADPGLRETILGRLAGRGRAGAARAPRHGAQRGPLGDGAPARAPLLAARPPRPRGRRCRPPALPAAARHRAGDGGPRRLPLHPGRRLQGPRRAGAAQPLLPGAEAPRLRLGGDHRPQPLFHQHPADGAARPALLACLATTARSTPSPGCARRRGCSASPCRRAAATPRTSTAPWRG